MKTKVVVKLPFQIAKISHNITKAQIIAPQNEGFKFSVLALSDTHIDSNKSDHDLFHNFCNQALETKSGIFINGGFMTLWQGQTIEEMHDQLYDLKSQERNILMTLSI